MNFAAITSMNEAYYKHVGKSMLGSFKKNWSHLFPMHVYNEDNFLIKVKTIESMGWDLGDHYKLFQQRHTNRKILQFSKKAFSIIKAMEEIDCDRLIWIDADTIIKKEIPLQLLELMSPDDVLSSHFSVWHEVDGKKYHSCETGFFILNKKHPGFNKFYSMYKTIYENDITHDLRRFYDGEVYGKTVEHMKSTYKVLNLNTGKFKTPIPRSVLAPYIDHLKAGAKDDFTNEKIEKLYNLESEE